MPPKIHLVQLGDSMWRIAKNYGVDVDKLIQANPEIKDANKIAPGDKINIPGVLAPDKPLKPAPGGVNRNRPRGEFLER